MKKNTGYIWLGVMLLVRCGTENPQPAPQLSTRTDTNRVVNENPVADTATEIPVVIPRDVKSTFEQKTSSFATAYAANYDTLKSEQRHVLMRFENKWMKQLMLVKRFSVPYKDTALMPVAYIGFYTYTDSVQCANALSNWLACFGSDCNQIVPDEQKKIASSPGFYIINEKEIITLDYSVQHEKNNWEEMKKNLKTLFANQTSRLVEINTRGQVTWVK